MTTITIKFMDAREVKFECEKVTNESYDTVIDTLESWSHDVDSFRIDTPEGEMTGEGRNACAYLMSCLGSVLVDDDETPSSMKRSSYESQAEETEAHSIMIDRYFRNFQKHVTLGEVKRVWSHSDGCVHYVVYFFTNEQIKQACRIQINEHAGSFVMMFDAEAPAKHTIAIQTIEDKALGLLNEEIKDLHFSLIRHCLKKYTMYYEFDLVDAGSGAALNASRYSYRIKVSEEREFLVMICEDLNRIYFYKNEDEIYLMRSFDIALNQISRGL